MSSGNRPQFSCRSPTGGRHGLIQMTTRARAGGMIVAVGQRSMPPPTQDVLRGSLPWRLPSDRRGGWFTPRLDRNAGV
jgi:hypothetical protein